MEIRKGYVDCSLGQLHYRFAGKGKTLLMLHISPSSSHFFEPLMRELASHFLVLALDTPGYGLSDPPPHPFSIAEYAGIVVEFLDALQMRSASVLGHHTGACIACELAAMAPRRVEKLILSGAPCFDAEERERWLQRFQPLVLQEDGSHLQAIWNAMAHHEWDLAAKHEEAVWRLKAGPRWYEGDRADFTYDMTSRLPIIRAPTLVMAGELDSMRGPVEWAARLVKNSRTLILPGGTTRMPYTRPKEFARAVLDFLNEG